MSNAIRQGIQQIASRVLIISAMVLPNLPSDLLAGSEFAHTESINLPLSADFVKILPDDNQVLLISNRDQKVARFDLEKRTVLGSANLKYNVTDCVVDTSGRYAYLIGYDTKQDNTGYVTRFDMSNDRVTTITISERLIQPKIAIAGDGRLFIGDQVSSVLKMVGAESFEDFSDISLHTDLSGIGFLKRGPVASIGVTWDGKFLFVSHVGTSAISIVDTKKGETLFTYELPQTDGVMRPYSAMAVANGASLKEPSRTSVLLGSDQDNSFVVLDFDPRFRTLDVVQAVTLGFGRVTYDQLKDDRYRKPMRLLIGTDTEQRAMVVGHQGSKRVVVFARHGKVIEQRSMVDLPAEPLYLDVSRGGDFGIVVDNRGNALTVIRWSEGSVISRAPMLRSDDLSTAQRLLATQGYPIGAVDGIDGPRTRRAIKLFQERAGIKSTGNVDAPTLSALHAAAIAVFRGALRVYSPERSPVSSAVIQWWLGSSLAALGEKDATTERLQEAVESLSAALRVFEAEGPSDLADLTKQDLARAQALLQGRRS
jgi:hypothetical protein